MRRRGGALAVGVSLADLTGPKADRSKLVELRWSSRGGVAAEVQVPARLSDAIDAYLRHGAMVAVAGPQGLAGLPGATARACERALFACHRVGHALPAPGKPSAGFITGSVRFFAALARRTSARLHGTCAHSEANLIEAMPSAAWPLLADGGRVDGLKGRAELLEGRGLDLRPLALDGAFLAAALAAYTASCFRDGSVGSVGHGPWLDHAIGLLREGYVVQPLRRGAS